MTKGVRAGSHHISTLNEKPLHAALKEWVAQPGDQFEVGLEGFVIDIIRGDLLIEIQTANFFSIKRKLLALTARHPVRLAYPVAREKWIVKLADDERSQLSRRKSPKRGKVHHLFGQLVSFPALMAEPNFTLEVLLVQEDEVRRHVPGRAWRRRGWVTEERRLLQVVERHSFGSPQDLAGLLPPELPEQFTSLDIARALHQTRRLATQTAYCLREMGAIQQIGKRGNAYLYERAV